MLLTFCKQEKLCSRRLIDELHADGNRLMAFPFSVHWKVEQLDVPCQVLIVAPKRKFKRAVDRNRVKRLARECYRLHKPDLYAFLQEHGVSITLSLVYVHNEIIDYDVLYRKFDKLIAQLKTAIAKQ